MTVRISYVRFLLQQTRVSTTACNLSSPRPRRQRRGASSLLVGDGGRTPRGPRRLRMTRARSSPSCPSFTRRQQLLIRKLVNSFPLAQSLLSLLLFRISYCRHFKFSLRLLQIFVFISLRIFSLSFPPSHHFQPSPFPPRSFLQSSPSLSNYFHSILSPFPLSFLPF